MIGRIDDENFPELGCKLPAFAQEIDQVAHCEMFGESHEVAAHQSPGGLFGIGQRGFDRRAVFGLHFGENGLLVVLVEVFEHRDGIVGIEPLGDVGNSPGIEVLDKQFADMIVELGDDLDAHQVGNGAGEGAALVAVDQFEQVGNVGWVERLDQVIDPVRLARIQRITHAAHEFGLERVFLFVEHLLETRRFARESGNIVQSFVSVIGAHRGSSRPLETKSKRA
jgi:hypothetical protein